VRGFQLVGSFGWGQGEAIRGGKGRPAGLCGAQIGSDDFGVGILVADVDWPYPCAGANVEDPAGLGAEGGEEEFAAHCQAEHSVGEIKAIELALTGWCQRRPSFGKRGSYIVVGRKVGCGV